MMDSPLQYTEILVDYLPTYKRYLERRIAGAIFVQYQYRRVRQL